MDFVVLKLRKRLWWWDFIALGSDGHLGGVVTNFNTQLTMLIYFVVNCGHYIEFYYKGLDRSYLVINLYEPFELNLDIKHTSFLLIFLIGSFKHNFCIKLDAQHHESRFQVILHYNKVII